MVSSVDNILTLAVKPHAKSLLVLNTRASRFLFRTAAARQAPPEGYAGSIFGVGGTELKLDEDTMDKPAMHITRYAIIFMFTMFGSDLVPSLVLALIARF